MSAPPFMQLYVADFLADTQHLTTEEIGAYLLILMTMWRSGGSLPHDQKVLARCARLSGRRWADAWERLSPLLTISGGQVTQKRLSEEYAKAMQKSAVRAASGSKGGAAKALKGNELPLANGHVLPQHSSDIRLKKEKKKKDGAKAPSLLPGLQFPDWWPVPAWEGYVAMRKKKRAPMTDRAVEMVIAEVTKLRAAGQDPAAVMDQSTRKAWTDVYPVKGGDAGAGGLFAAPPLPDAATWVWRLEAFHHGNEEQELVPGYWQAKWGPQPGQAGCLVPTEAIDVYRRRRPPAAAVGAA